jgi:peptidoglycan DL-endopeptidase CwlO
MHQSRLVGGLACVGAALLALLLLSAASLAEPNPSPTASATPAVTASPTPAVTASPTSRPRPAPRLTRRQRRLRRIKRERLRVVGIARRQLGVPYVWGGDSRRGFDCSGLTMYVYRHIGIRLAHSATMQSRRGVRVSLHHLRAGDLLFFGHPSYYHHVAMYVGHGRMIEAPHRGARVRICRPWGPTAARRLLHG